MTTLEEKTKLIKTNNDEKQEEEEEETKEIDNDYKTRASLAALDLPIKSLQNDENKQEVIPGDDDLPSPGLLNRAHSLDSGLNKITTQPTVEMLISSNDFDEPIKEKVIVPSRDVLVKMPFYSTPLTIEATNNAFRDFMVRLNEMGFEQQAEAALVATNAESVESAIEFIMNHPDSLYHRFKSQNIKNDKHDKNENDLTQIIIKQKEENELCIACGLNKNQHIIDENGEKIITIKNDDDKDDNDDNDNKRQQQQQQQQKLQAIIQERVKSIGEEQEEEDDDEEEQEIFEEKVEEKKNNKLNLDKKIDGGATQKCMICFDDKSLEMFSSASCGHNYCRECLEEHYKIKTKDGDVLKLSCIDPKCNREIGEDEILNFLIDEDLILKFKKFRQQKLIMLNPSARFCCKPDCEGYMIGSRIKRKLICPLCSTAICWNCSQPWHGFFVGCNQNIDIGYTKWALNKDVQKCPKCRVRIEKAEGCNHMTCQSCKYEFCWICKGPYNDRHFEWWNIFGCPGAQYTPRFCRCPICFPRWLNRILIILCFLSIVVPIVIIAGIFWFLIICLVFCVRCDLKCDIDPCDCF